MSTRDFLNKQPGIRQVNSDEYDQAMQKYTPVNQQNVSSHVATPALIAFIVAIVVTGMAAAAMLRFWGGVDPFYLLMVFGASFLLTFLKRIGVADKVMWAIEEMLNRDIDGDGAIGIAPRSVPVTTKGQTRDIPMPDQPEELYREDWAQVAIALLHNRGSVSRRGIRKNSKLSQSKAQLAANMLQKGYAENGGLNERGWDWLHAYLPDNYTCVIERPEHPPTPQNAREAVG